MKIASIVGARPNFIKLAPVSKELRKKFDEVLIHTGQHYDYDMNKIFFDELGIPEPDYHLEVGSGSHGYQTGEMLKRTEEVLTKEAPDLVLVFGDTNTTLAGAFAASKLHIKVGHIEAGLRSFDRRMPEETNRVLTDHCSDLLFCPTETAVKILTKEGIENGVHLTGDVMVDALKENIEIAEQKSMILDELSLKPEEYYLATIHRPENTDDFNRLKSIVAAFCVIGNLVFPSHPRTEKCLKQFGLWGKLTNKIKVIKPVGYLDMLMLEKNARKILTDSGGVQKEAYIFKVPCITLRKNTEWVETVEDGGNVLVGADKEKIIKMVNEFEPESEQRDIFGSGSASERIKKIIWEIFIKKKYVIKIKNCFAENASQSSFSQKDLELLKKHFGVRVVDFVLCRRNLKGTLMAPFKMVKDVLNHLEEWTTKRQDNARFYSKALADIDELETPQIAEGRKHIFNQYTIRVKKGKRDKLKGFLEGQGISTAIYYPLPLHLQPCFSFLGYNKWDFPFAEKASAEVLSLPVYPELEKEEREYVVEKIREFIESRGRRR